MKNFLPILSIESSAENCGVSVFFSENKYTDFNINLKNIHSEKLFELIEMNLKSLQINLNEIKSIAVSSGPGSFTGLRIGFAAAKGIAVGKNLPIIPVPTFDAIAYKVSNILNNRKFAIIKKANLTENYYAEFESTLYGTYTTTLSTNLVDSKNLQFEENQIIFSDVINSNFYQLPKLNGVDIAIWAYKFGKDLLNFEFDFIEPSYFKDFIPKVKK